VARTVVIMVLAGGTVVLLWWPQVAVRWGLAWFGHATDRWWWQAVFGPRGLQTAGVIVASLLALWLLGWVWCEAGRPVRFGVRRFHGDQSGTAMLEFVLLLPWALMIFLILIQAGLLYSANFHVGYAAFCAARSAMVWAWPVPETAEQKAAIVRYPPEDAQDAELPVFDVSRLPELQSRPRSAAIFACLPIAGTAEVGEPFWRCVCGYVHEGAAPPMSCPNCGRAAGAFSQISAGEDGVGQAHEDAWRLFLGPSGPRWLSGSRLERKYRYASGWAYSKDAGPVLLTEVEVTVQSRPAPFEPDDPGWKYFYDPGCESWRAQEDKPASCGGGSGWQRCHGTRTIEGEYPWETQVVVDFAQPPLEELARDPRQMRVPLTVRVRHRFQLRVPYAARILRDGTLTYPKGQKRFSYVELSAAYTVLTEGQREHRWDDPSVPR